MLNLVPIYSFQVQGNIQCYKRKWTSQFRYHKWFFSLLYIYTGSINTLRTNLRSYLQL
jgi:hypothetical protein